ncbi:hypothetical protein EVAR_100898_1 [Eumeta japonica]|uniref:Uncharacterized protein n=1 Tax=Eumeta variegata TaxID=151549 RepID=A0A4C2A497_EUMVA|nr:hypothetical protein EVAR_100898_1 [Eumeta japonica]
MVDASTLDMDDFFKVESDDPARKQKLKFTLLELKAIVEMCDFLMSERDDHETEIRSVAFINTKLKNELADIYIKCSDLSDQRDRLRVLVSKTDDCRKQYEQSLLQIQALQEELHSS